MAINVDSVYRTILRILNKESRGTISPDEFAKIGQQAQLSIIDRNFHRYNNAVSNRKSYNSSEGYGDIVAKIRESLDDLNKEATITFAAGEATLPAAFRILDVSSSDRTVRYEEVSKNEASHLLRSKLTAPTTDFPIFYRKENGAKIDVKPNVAPLTTASVVVDYIEYPNAPRWGYITNTTTGAREYDSNAYEANGLVVKENAFSIIQTNISNGVDGTFEVEADISTGGLIPLTVTVSGNTVTAIEVTQPLSLTDTGFISGTTLTVQTYIGAPVAGDLEVTGASSDLVIEIASTDIYNGSTAGSIDFSLHESEEPNLVKEILAYSGITLKDAEVTAQASQIIQSESTSKRI